MTERTIRGIKRIRDDTNITDYDKKLVTEGLVEWLKAAGAILATVLILKRLQNIAFDGGNALVPSQARKHI